MNLLIAIYIAGAIVSLSISKWVCSRDPIFDELFGRNIKLTVLTTLISWAFVLFTLFIILLNITEKEKTSK